MTLFPALDLALVSTRVPEAIVQSVPGLRGRVHLVRDADSLALLRDGGLGRDGKLRLVVLDTKLTAAPGGFDVVDAARALSAHPERAGQTLVWMHDSPSSLHVAEEVAREYRPGSALAGRLIGAVCDGACITDAVNAVYTRQPWVETHFDARAITGLNVLFDESRRPSIGPAIMIATAARPMPWREMSELLHADVDYLRQALRERVRPAVVRLGWIRASDRLTVAHLANLVGRRRDYFERFARRYRSRDLYPLFLTG